MIEKTLKFHCCGCGRPIPWDGKGLFSYTCYCGATLLADEDGKFVFPCSFIQAIRERRELPHIDYYLGISNYVSAEKQKAYELLKSYGAKWSWECDKCRERLIERVALEIREGFRRLDFLHPELKALVTAKVEGEKVDRS